MIISNIQKYLKILRNEFSWDSYKGDNEKGFRINQEWQNRKDSAVSSGCVEYTEWICSEG